jgi:hypothetical protein
MPFDGSDDVVVVAVVVAVVVVAVVVVVVVVEVDRWGGRPVALLMHVLSERLVGDSARRGPGELVTRDHLRCHRHPWTGGSLLGRAILWQVDLLYGDEMICRGRRR